MKAKFILRIALAFIMVGTYATLLFAWSGEAASDGVGIYENNPIRLNEEAVRTLRAGEPVQVLSTRGNMHRVRHASGAEGWVESRLINRAQAIGKQIEMTGEQVLGQLGEIEAVFIFEEDDKKLRGLQVERSFVDEMNAPKDREELEREHTEFVRW